MHFAGRQFVRVDVSLLVRVRMSACIRATLACMQPDVVDRRPHIASHRIPLIATCSHLRPQPVAATSTGSRTSRLHH